MQRRTRVALGCCIDFTQHTLLDAPAPVPLLLPPPSEAYGPGVKIEPGAEMRTEMQEDEWMDAYLGTDAQGEQLREELQAQLQRLL